MRVLVCGGRDFNDKDVAFAVLDALKAKYGDIVIIQGGAPGADRLAKIWAKENNVRCEQYNADWDRYGKAAGPIRNQWMIDDGKPDLFVAFPGGNGTADMVAKCRKAGISGANTSRSS